MTLSIADAAAEAPDRVGLIVATSDGLDRLTFAELAARAAAIGAGRDPGAPLVATPTVETATALYARMHARQPVVLVHPRLTDAERGALLAGARPIDPAALAVVFTSGSSGRPRGVVLGRDAFVAAAAASAANLGWREDDRWLCCLPLAHVGGLSILVRCLLARRTAIVTAFDARPVAALLAAERVTLLSLVPTMLARLLDLARPSWTPPRSLRAVLLGGAAADDTLVARAAARGVPVLRTYGMTETCSQLCTQPYETAGAVQPGVGSPVPGAELRIDHGRILARGPMLMSGYLDGAPPPLDADGWLDTGDRGAVDDRGWLHVFGRGDDTIITGGENVHPAEVEAVLASCPGVAAACAFAALDPMWGQIVAAAVVARDDGPAALAAIDRAARTALAPFKRPRRLYLVDALPLGPSGKIDRRALARQLVIQEGAMPRTTAPR